MSLPITAIFAGLNALILFRLSLNVIRIRRAKKNGFGAGGDEDLIRAMRGQANAAEYIPLCLILLALIEAQGAPIWVTATLGALWLIGRLLHGFAFATHTSSHFPQRVVGMHLTFWPLLAAAIGLIGHGAYELIT